MDIVQKLSMSQSEYENYLFEEWITGNRLFGGSASVQYQWTQSPDYQEVYNNLTGEAAGVIQVLRAELSLNQAQGELVQYLKRLLAKTLMDTYDYTEGVASVTVDALVQYRDIK